MKSPSPLVAALLRGSATLVPHRATQGSLLILGFHRVLPEADPLLPDEPDVATFGAQMDVLSTMCTVLPLAEAIERLFARSLPPRAASVTFDDGYTNNLTQAAPVLRARGLPATVFIATSFLNSGRMWNDTIIESVRQARMELDLSTLGLGRFELTNVTARFEAVRSVIARLKYLPPGEREQLACRVAELARADLPPALMLSESQIKQLVQQGIDIAAHTVTHPILTSVREDEARKEIESSKARLEAISGMPVRLFAYPNGRPGRDYQRVHVEMVRRAGFSAAVSASWGLCRPNSDRFQLPRMLPWEISPIGFGLRLLQARWSRREEAA